jgi:hypothetical protein
MAAQAEHLRLVHLAGSPFRGTCAERLNAVLVLLAEAALAKARLIRGEAPGGIAARFV